MKREYSAQPLVGVGGIVVREGRILLVKRRNELGRGKWSIPGGLVELGETLEQAVIREVKEETSLDVESPQYIDVVDNIDRDEKGRVRYHFVIVDCRVRPKGGEARVGSDAEEVEWVALDEVEDRELTKTFRLFFKRNVLKLRTPQNST